MLRRFGCFIMLAAFLLAVSACNKPTVEPQSDAQSSGEVLTEQPTPAYDNTTVNEEPVESVTQVDSTAAATEIPSAETTEADAVTQPQSTQSAAETAASWNAEQIVAFYKGAAEKTGKTVQSSQTVGLQDISVNNGALSGVFSYITPILSSFLSSSVTETDGITGEFSLLTADDVKSAKAYECTAGTAVEITLKSQTDNADSDRTDGSVAHGISVVGDLPLIMGQLKEKGLPIDISTENTVLTYTEPVIKAVIGKDGSIVNGTWSCTVEISLSDYKFAGAKVDSTVVVLDNKITVDGGFKP